VFKCFFSVLSDDFIIIYLGVNLTSENNKGQLDAYIKSAEWDLEDFSASSNASKYDCCPTLYPYVLFTIRMRRRSLYYFTNIVGKMKRKMSPIDFLFSLLFLVPCFLISCMTLVGFLVAPDTGEKVTLRIITENFIFEIHEFDFLYRNNHSSVGDYV